MAYTVEAAFDSFFESINLSGDNRAKANARKDHLVGLLSKKFNVRDAFATGSVPRFTALAKGADVDVMVVLHYGQHIKDKRPSEVLKAVRDALAEYKTNVRRNGQAVTLYYDTWPNVDITPAAQLGDTESYNIPNMKREQWIRTSPKAHSEDIENRSTLCGPLFRKIIKLMKRWNEDNGGYLQSYHIEVIALYAFTGPTTDPGFAAFTLFNKAYEMTAFPIPHAGALVDDYLDASDRLAVRSRLQSAKGRALEAWIAGSTNDVRKAISIWRALLGNDFPAYG